MESKPPSSSTTAPSSKRIKKEKVVKTPNSLLLAYTYFLNNQHTCKIILGYSISSFQTTLLLQRNGTASVSITFSEWEQFYNSHKDLETKRNETCSQLFEDIVADAVLNITDHCTVQFGNFKSFLLKRDEFEVLDKMVDFINIVLSYNKTAEDNVQEYFYKYIEKCKEKNLTKLPFEDCYIPMQISFVHCNYSRLFYEIPLFCSETILKKLMEETNKNVKYKNK